MNGLSFSADAQPMAKWATPTGACRKCGVKQVKPVGKGSQPRKFSNSSLTVADCSIWGQWPAASITAHRALAT